MKWISTLCLLVLAGMATRLSAQGKNGSKAAKVTPQDFVLPAAAVIDSNSNAVILSDLGTTEFIGNKNGWFSYVFKRRTRIRILNKKAFELATVKIHLYENATDKEVLSAVNATTYNLENGQVMAVPLGKDDLFADRLDKNNTQQKFTMPAVKEGSVIEYSYTITSDFIFRMRPWEFQNMEYPCLWSEYQVTIPSLLVYIFQKNGVHPFFIDKAEEGHETYLITETKPADGAYAPPGGTNLSVSANTSKHRWVIKDIPAFYAENYLSSPANYIDKIEFQLHQTNNGETTTDVMNTWAKATDELLKSEDFGLPLSEERNEYWLDKALSGITKENRGALQQAKDIYYYLANNFTCTSYYDKYINTTLQDVLKKRSGGVGELNLLLTALLLREKINAAPVLLSTREYGYNYPGYPVMDRLNYVVCRAVIDGKVYFLDASHNNLGFGQLPGNCYNGHARIISRTDSASIFLLPDSIKERKVTSVNIINDEKKKGLLSGSFQIQMGNMESYALRETIAKEGQKNYFTAMLNAARGDADITSCWIDSLQEPENPAKIEAAFLLKTGDNAELIYFNPVLWAGYKANPFAAATRQYPVEMDYPLNETYVLRMEIPEGFAVEELPKMTRMIYNVGEGIFEYLLQKTADFVQLRCSLQFKKANFDSDDYDSLREFFGQVVKKENEQIVFRKKK